MRCACLCLYTVVESQIALYNPNVCVVLVCSMMSVWCMLQASRGKASKADLPETPVSGKRRRASTKVSVSAYCEDHPNSADEEKILSGKAPKGYKLVIPADSDDDFDQVRAQFYCESACSCKVP